MRDHIISFHIREARDITINGKQSVRRPHRKAAIPMPWSPPTATSWRQIAVKIQTGLSKYHLLSEPIAISSHG